MNKVFFINLYDHSFDKKSPFWEQKIDFALVSDVEELIFWFETELMIAQANFEEFQEIGKCFLIDLLKLKLDKPEQIKLFDFLQFQISTSILNYLASNKLMNYCYDWLCNSICVEFVEDIEREINSDRIVDFIYSENPYILTYFKETFLEWTNNLFYYSRVTGGLNYLCIIFIEDFYSFLIEIFEEKIYYEKLITPLSNISTWCYTHGKEELNKKSCEILFELYNIDLPIESKKIIAFHFSCRKNSYNKFSRKQWCEILTNEYLKNMFPHEHLQLFANKYENNVDSILENIDELYESFKLYKEPLKEFENDILIHYELSRFYVHLLFLLQTLIQNGETKLVIEIITKYFEIDEKLMLDDKILFIIPNTISGVLYSINKNQIYTDTNTIINIPKLTALGNSFLSTTNTFYNLLEFEYENPHRFGAPNPEKAAPFFDVIKEHFDFKKLLYLPNIETISGIHLSYGSQIPIQSIISKELNVLLPIIQSFEKPNMQRVIRKVLIWEGETNLSQTECNSISNIFNKKNIETNKLCFQSSSKEEFLENYNDDSYDLIWICCHGQYNHMEAHKSYLDLGNNIHLNLEDLNSNLLKTTNRRLIMVDACDGATTSLINSPLSIGIGSTLVSSKQSLISHNWPIDNYSALISGVILASFLSDRLEYGDALNETINLFYSGKVNVIERIRQYCDIIDVIDRIENSTIDFQNFYSWGSLTYLI